MIEKFLTVKSIGRIENLKCSGDVQFHKVNLIYGENGSGKSTLAGILRCLGNGSPLRHCPTLGSSVPQKITVRYSGNNLKYDNGKWDSTLSDLVVFDSVFVAENVYAGDVIDHRHKKNLCNFVFGASGVKLATKIDRLDGEIRKQNTDINAKKELIQAHCGNLPVADFVKLKPVDSVHDLIISKKREIAELKSSQELSKRAEFRLLRLPTLPNDDLSKLLGTTLEDMAEDAEKLTRRQVQNHLDQHGEKWLEQGVTYSTETCPFCGSDTRENPLVKAYRSYFSQKYKDIKARINSVLSDIESKMSEQALLTMQKVFLENVALADYWKDYIPVNHHDLSFAHVKMSWSTLKAEMIAVLEKKMSAPLEQIALPESLLQAFASYADISNRVGNYNLSVAESNKNVVAKKESIKSGNLSQAESDLVMLETAKKRDEPKVKALCSQLTSLESEKREKEKEKRTTREELNKSSSDLLVKYQETINRHLANCNAGFCMVETKPSYQGGSTSVDYCLEINNCVVPLAEPKSGSDTACFGNTLSEGDKNSLAFAFFLAKLEQDPNLSNKIIVLDDPVCSLDEHRIAYTVDRIGDIATGCEQLVVLSHDLDFARQVWDGIVGDDRQALELWKTTDGSLLRPFDVEEAAKDKYFRQCGTLERCVAYDREIKPEDAVYCIRPVLEHNLRIRFPRSLSEYSTRPEKKCMYFW